MKSSKQYERLIKMQNVYVDKVYDNDDDFKDDTLMMLNEIENYLLIKRKEMRHSGRNKHNEQHKTVKSSYTTPERY
jgi:hypothetical protein